MNKKFKEILDKIYNYYHLSRKVGHTTTMIEGAKNHDCLVMLANIEQCKWFKKEYPKINTISLYDSIEKLTGFNKPLLIDNHAIFELLGGALRLIKDLENEVSFNEDSFKYAKEEIE